MNPAQQQMKDPSAGVPPQLLQHVHLVSKQRYPHANNPPIEGILSYLLEAQKIIHDASPVQWQLLDCPTDGTIMLMWQPPDQGHNFASDGYIWGDQETVYNSDVRGHSLQMYIHRSGFKPGEQVATHSRRRYRLIPTQQNAGGPMPDPALWIIHYSKAQQRDHMPSASIQILPQVHASLQQRRMIMQQGAIQKKEFMLRDRANWPTITLPGTRPAPGAQAAGGPHRRGPSTGVNVGIAEPTIEEEEDVSRGDALDFITPREVSRLRYEQNHEWMEEILQSPYATLSIVPPELGLGRKGELELLTKNFFDAPTAVQESSSSGYPARVGRMDPAKAAEFTRHAHERIAAMEAELVKMKQAHQKRMERLRQSSALSNAEKRLRALQFDSPKQKSTGVGIGAGSPADGTDSLDEIIGEVENATGKKVHEVKLVTMMSKGGYQPELAPQVASPTDVRAGSNTSNVASQAQIQSQPQSHPQNQPQSQHPQQHAPHSNQAATQSNNQIGVATSQPAAAQRSAPQANPQDDDKIPQDNKGSALGGDIVMGDVENEPENNAQPEDSEDWVMVGDKDMQTSSAQGAHASDALPGHQSSQMPQSTGETNPEPHTHIDEQPGQESVQDGNHDLDEDIPLDAGDFDIGNDFENSAGDALAGFDADDDLHLDDSAFGDAFPPQD